MESENRKEEMDLEGEEEIKEKEIKPVDILKFMQQMSQNIIKKMEEGFKKNSESVFKKMEEGFKKNSEDSIMMLKEEMKEMKIELTSHIREEIEKTKITLKNEIKIKETKMEEDVEYLNPDMQVKGSQVEDIEVIIEPSVNDLGEMEKKLQTQDFNTNEINITKYKTQEMILKQGKQIKINLEKEFEASTKKHTTAYHLPLGSYLLPKLLGNNQDIYKFIKIEEIMLSKLLHKITNIYQGSEKIVVIKLTFVQQLIKNNSHRLWDPGGPDIIGEEIKRK